MYEMRAHPQILRNCIYRKWALLPHRAPLGSRSRRCAAKENRTRSDDERVRVGQAINGGRARDGAHIKAKYIYLKIYNTHTISHKYIWVYVTAYKKCNANVSRGLLASLC